MKIEAESYDGDLAIVLSAVYSGVRIRTEMGLFGIAERDGGIEVLFNGKTVWTSHELNVDAESECMVSGVLGEEVLASGVGTALPSDSPDVAGRLPDGSGFFTASLPLPKGHWLYVAGRSEPPMPMRVGLGPKRDELAAQIRAATQYAVRASTMNGTVADFDPDAVVQNTIVGLLGYWTSSGLSTTGGLVEE